MILHVNTAARKEPTKLVAVVVPLSKRRTLTPDEQISLRHAAHYFSRYDKYLVAPGAVAFEHPGFQLKLFAGKFFGSAAAHARLVTAPLFYETFADYKYILLYHLDSLVLSDQLEQWCQTDLDYIGPPWINCPDSPWVKRERVGNSGFALMKIQSFLNVLYSPRPTVDPNQYWQEYYASKPKYIQYMNLPKRFLKRLFIFNSSRFHMFRWLQHRTEADIFWSDEAVHYYPDFKIADVATGLRFAFEVSPRLCLERNQQQLPFGCHAWPRYDRAFWEPYLLQEDPSGEKKPTVAGKSV
jgi:Protein of unknown function (DUF5672)